MRLPIAEPENFTLYKFLPTPQKVAEKSYRMFNVPNRPLLVNHKKTKFYIADEPLNCVHGLNHRYCKLETNVVKMSNQKRCEISVINDKVDMCEEQYFELVEDVYMPLKSGFQWFISPVKNFEFHISCFKATIHIDTFKINTNSILSVDLDFRVENSVTEFIPTRNLNVTSIEHLNFTSVIDNITIPNNILPKIRLDFINLDSLKSDGMKLKDLNKKLIDLKNEGRFEFHYQMGFQIMEKIGYIACGLIIFYVIVKLADVKKNAVVNNFLPFIRKICSF